MLSALRLFLWAYQIKHNESELIKSETPFECFRLLLFHLTMSDKYSMKCSNIPYHLFISKTLLQLMYIHLSKFCETRNIFKQMQWESFFSEYLPETDFHCFRYWITRTSSINSVSVFMMYVEKCRLNSETLSNADMSIAFLQLWRAHTKKKWKTDTISKQHA